MIDLIRSKPPLLHLVLTGRDAAPEVISLADTVSEVREITHAYRKGIEPQPGVDFLSGAGSDRFRLKFNSDQVVNTRKPA